MAATSLPILFSCEGVARQTALVSLDPTATRQAAQEIAKFLETSSFELGSWAKEPLHPKTINHAYGCDYNFFDWIFFVSTLNFSFWSDLSQEDRFGIEWQKGLDGKGGSGTTVHTGYASLLAGLARAWSDGLPLTHPQVYSTMSLYDLEFIFKTTRAESMPLLKERLDALHEVGKILLRDWRGSFENVVAKANGSAVKLVQLIVDNFPPFRDVSTFRGHQVYFYKRAQICVAELWAALEGKGLANFSDIDQLTAFADYRVPQILESMGMLKYSDKLRTCLLEHSEVPPNSEMEVSIRALTLLAVEELRKALAAEHGKHLSRSLFFGGAFEYESSSSLGDRLSAARLCPLESGKTARNRGQPPPPQD